jgi:hypothetical protein
MRCCIRYHRRLCRARERVEGLPGRAAALQVPLTEQRGKFSIAAWAKERGMEAPLASTYFVSSPA